MNRDALSHGTLVIVPTDLHAAHLAERGVLAETRRSLFRRLVTAFLPEHTFASQHTAFLSASHALQSPVLARAIERELNLLTDAHGTAAAALAVLAKGRMRAFKKAIDASGRALDAAGIAHPRTAPALLSGALFAADPEDVHRVVGPARVVTRFVYDWSASDGAVFRALDAALSRVGGSATVTLPDVAAAFDGAREESPHDVIADACARVLDAAPRFLPEAIASTWTGPVAPTLLEKTSVIRAADLAAESAACAGDVRSALERGVPVDGIGIALPLRGGAPEESLVRALAEHGIRSSRQDEAVADSAPVQVAFAALREHEATPPTATRNEYVQYAYKIWSALELAREAGLGAFGILATDASESALDRAELDAVALSAAAWDALALTDYAAAMARLGLGEKSVTLDTFLAEITQSMPPARDPASRRAGAVRIGVLLDFVGIPLDLLVIMSANEGALDSDVTAVEDAMVERLARERTAANQVRVASSLAHAKRVTFTFRARDEDGSALAPAAFVAWLVRGGVPEDSRGASPFDPRRRSPRATRLRQVAASESAARRLAPAAHARAEIERERERFFLDPRRQTSEVTGALRSNAAIDAIITHETGGAERSLSVTSLERAAACAFVGFAECVAGAREKLEDEKIPDARQEGNLVHAALAAAFTEARDLFSAVPSSRGVDAILRVGVTAARASLPESVPSVISARVLSTVATLLRVAAEDVEHRFYAAEQEFGEGKPWPAHVIERAGQANERAPERLSLRGSIDRVDVARDELRARAMDYKRRKSTIAKAVRSLGVTHLQVPLYARVIARALEKSVGESGFLPTEPKDLSDVTPPKALSEAMARVLVEEEGLAAIERRALDVVRGLRLGQLVPLPIEPQTCVTCSHDGACRKPRFSIEPEEKPA